MENSSKFFLSENLSQDIEKKINTFIKYNSDKPDIVVKKNISEFVDYIINYYLQLAIPEILDHREKQLSQTQNHEKNLIEKKRTELLNIFQKLLYRLNSPVTNIFAVYVIYRVSCFALYYL